jgi:hypothetical protein
MLPLSTHPTPSSVNPRIPFSVVVAVAYTFPGSSPYENERELYVDRLLGRMIPAYRSK